MENGTCCTCKKERNKQKKRKRVERRKEEVGIRPSFDEVAWDQEERRRQQGKAIVQRQLQQLEEKLSQYPRLHRQANIDLQRKQQRRQGETMDQWVDRLVAMEALAKRLIHTKEDLDQLEVEWLDEKDLAERFKSRPDKKEEIMQNGRQKECPILECTLYGIPINKSLTTDSTKDICEHSSKGCEESKHKAPEKAKKDVKTNPQEYHQA